jgi:hypothetical protein
MNLLGKDMKKTPSRRQLKYAYGLMNEKKSKYQIALDAGFSPATARVPKLIENKQGFSLAMAQIAGETENTMMKLMFELKGRDLSKLSIEELVEALGTLSKTWQRFTPIQTSSR